MTDAECRLVNTCRFYRAYHQSTSSEDRSFVQGWCSGENRHGCRILQYHMAMVQTAVKKYPPPPSPLH